MSEERSIAIPKFFSIDLFDLLFFLYCATLHADSLAFQIFGFQVRFNNILAFFLFTAFLYQKGISCIKLEKTFAIAILIIGASIFISFLLSPFKERAFFFFIFFLFTGIAYLIFPYLVMIHMDTKKILRLYFLSFFVVGLYALLQLILGMVGISDPFANQKIINTLCRPNAFAYEPSFYAIYFAPFVVITNLLYFLNAREHFLLFPYLGIWKMLFINLLFLVSTSTSAYFCYIIFFASIFLFLLSSKIRDLFPTLFKGWSLACLCFIGSTILGVFFLNGLLQEYYLKFFFKGFAAHPSFFERWIGIFNAWQLFLLHPVWGVGLGAIPPFFWESYLKGDSRFYLLIQEGNIPFTDFPLKLFEPSNVFTELLASLGLVGFFAFLFLIVLFIRKGIQALFFAENKSEKTWVFAFLISNFISLILLQVNQGLFRTYIWTHFALGYALFFKVLSSARSKSLSHLSIHTDCERSLLNYNRINL